MMPVARDAAAPSARLAGFHCSCPGRPARGYGRSLRDLRSLHRCGGGCLLSLRSGDLLSGHYDRDDADDLRPDGERHAPSDGRVPARTVDRTLQRGGRRAALDQFWTPQNETALGTTPVGTIPELLRSDGADLWVSNGSGNSISRVRASDGKFLEEWTGATLPTGVLVAMGHVIGFDGAIQIVAGHGQIAPPERAHAEEIPALSPGDRIMTLVVEEGLAEFTAIVEAASVSIVTPGRPSRGP